MVSVDIITKAQDVRKDLDLTDEIGLNLTHFVKRAKEFYGIEIEIYFDDFTDGDVQNGLGVNNKSSGYCFKSDNVYKLIVNERFPGTRKRFVMAHQFGHVILGHLDNCDNGLVDFVYDSGIEHDADIFAKELLMPKTQVWKLCKYGGYNLKFLADVFGVTVEDIVERKRELGLLR